MPTGGCWQDGVPDKMRWMREETWSEDQWPSEFMDSQHWIGFSLCLADGSNIFLKIARLLTSLCNHGHGVLPTRTAVCNAPCNERGGPRYDMDDGAANSAFTSGLRAAGAQDRLLEDGNSNR